MILTTKCGTRFQVDKEVYGFVKRFNWYTKKSKFTTYIYASVRARPVALHRVLMATFPEEIVDHRNGDGTDNRYANLRIATASQNVANCKNWRNSTGYRGVSFQNNRPSEKKWRAVCQFNGKKIRLGWFKTKEEAAKSYDEKAKEVWGEFATLNFPHKDRSL